jgi:hypothetical protein
MYIARPKIKPAITSVAKCAPSMILESGIKIKMTKTKVSDEYFRYLFTTYFEIR